MDIVSISVAFLAGTATGAAGVYFGYKFTDQRREKDARREEDQTWKTVEKRFPKLVEEMKADFFKPENANVRTFFVKSSKTTLNPPPEPFFEYHTDVHPDIHAAIIFLEEKGYVSDITPGNCPKYRMHEKLAERFVR